MDLGPLFCNNPGALAGLLRKIKPRVIYDIGANDGSFMDVWLDSGALDIHAFEPVPDVLDTLRKHWGHDPRVAIHGIGISDKNAVVTNLKPHNVWTLMPCGARNDVSIDYVNKPPFSVSFTTLDQFSNTHPDPDFIKMDVDGYEYRALRGAIELLRRRRVPMYWECSYLPLLLGDSLEGTCKLIYELGYVAANLSLSYMAPDWQTLLRCTPMHSSFDIFLLPKGHV